MSTARIPQRSSTARRISSVHGSAPKMPISRLVLRGSTPWRLHLVEDREEVRRRHHDHARPEVDDQLHLPLGHAAADRHHRAAEPLGAVVRAEPAGEQPVAVGDVHEVPGPAAGGPDRARHHLGPRVDVVAGVADDGRLAGRAAARRARARPARAGPRTCRTGSSRAGRPWSVNGNRARSASGRRSSGVTPAVVEGARGSAGRARRRGAACSRSRSSWSASSSARVRSGISPLTASG